jgi:tetratricopeptide (TPR) repeat protein
MMRAAQRGVELGPDYWEAHNALAWARLGQGDWIGAHEAFERSVDLVRSSGSRMAFQYATYVAALGRMDEAIERLEALHAINPFDPEISTFLFNNVGVRGPLENLVAEAGSRGLTYEEAACTAFASASYIERGDADLVRACLALQAEGTLGRRISEVLTSRDATLEFIRNELESSSFISRRDLSFLMLMAGAYGDTDLANRLLREAFLRKGWGAHFLIWHDALSETRKTAEFGQFLEEYGVVELFRSTGEWNDYCRPVGEDEFECN